MSEADEAPSEQEVDAFLDILASPDFKGFCGCGHAHDHDGPGLLWNDAGHRLQIEQAIKILVAVEPAGEFLSLWSMAEFRKGFYRGLWEADYRAPYNNEINIEVRGVFSLKEALYTGHFYNPENQENLTRGNLYLFALSKFITEAFESGFSRITTAHGLATRKLEDWEVSGRRSDLSDSAKLFGIAAHFLTDLTQPMHAANFANVLGFYRDRKINPWDKRHKHFENCADRIINNPNSPYRPSLFCDPGDVEISFEDDLERIITQTATRSKGIFDRLIAPYMNQIAVVDYDKPIPESAGFPSFSESFPAGQINTARFLQQSVRQRRRESRSPRLRSDWVAVSERKDGHGRFFPCLFYRRDGDLCPVFRYYENSAWQEDAASFASFAAVPGQTSAATAFAACFDQPNEHPALFIAAADGQLSYFDAPDKQWRRTDI
ncbi:MAG: hypothetical protein RL367_531, partial [Pseudomonadota bacterium]